MALLRRIMSSTKVLSSSYATPINISRSFASTKKPDSNTSDEYRPGIYTIISYHTYLCVFYLNTGRCSNKNLR